MDWSSLYPTYFENNGVKSSGDNKITDAPTSVQQVEFADIGCGYGGLLGG